MRLEWGIPSRRSSLILGALVVLTLGLFDGFSGTVLMPLLVIGPLVAALGSEPSETAFLGIVTVVLTIALGWTNDLAGSTRHLVAVGVNVLGTVIAWQFASARSERDLALDNARPTLDRAARLTAAMHAGQVGEWVWRPEDESVTWDAQAAALFGLPLDRFGGTFDDWFSSVDQRDRPVVLDAITAGMAERRPFRFDHRCVWPDGSIHWLEGIGEPIVDERDHVTGAVGLVLDVDERHRELAERNRLLAIERAGRLRAEYLTRVQAVLSTSVDSDEILRRVTDAAVPDLADWCTAVLTIDRPPDHPVIVTAHSVEAMRSWARHFIGEHPYDPRATWGAATVVRTRRREVIEGLSATETDDPTLRELFDRADLDTVVTVPITGQLGVLGALQFCRGRHRPTFTASELELADELADRCGAALNNSILFGRQAASRAALDALQRVSGGLARAATRVDVANAVIEHGLTGLQATGAAVFVGDSGELQLVRIAGAAITVGTEHLGELAAKSTYDAVALRRVVHDGRSLTIAATGLHLRGRFTGALVFTFEGDRRFGTEETSMLITLGSRCAGALERASLYEGERETALVLQRRLLPAITSVPSWMEAAARYEPASGRQIGGDWFQLIDAEPGRTVAIVGDAVGHGIASAAAMGQLRAAIATAVAGTYETAAMLHIVDRFAAQGPDTLGASAVLVHIDESGSCDYLSAGHPPALLVRADGSVTYLEEGRRPLLGLGAAAADEPKIASFRFDPGDLVVLFTDGLVERRDEPIDAGLARLADVVTAHADLGLEELCELVVREMRSSEGEDDVAVLMLRRRTPACNTDAGDAATSDEYSDA